MRVSLWSKKLYKRDSKSKGSITVFVMAQAVALAFVVWNIFRMMGKACGDRPDIKLKWAYSVT